MYNIMIVVEESDLIAELSFLIGRNASDWRVSDFAEDTRTALQKAEKNPPDLVITDLQPEDEECAALIRTLRDRDLCHHSLILCGPDDFPAAVKLTDGKGQEVLYLPVNEPSLTDALRREAEILAQEQKHAEDTLAFRKETKSCLLRDYLLVRNAEASPALIRLLEEDGFLNPGHEYICLCFTRTVPSAGEKRMSDLIRQLLPLPYQGEYSECVDLDSDHAALLLAWPGDREGHVRLDTVRRLRQDLMDHGCPVVIGIGQIAQGFQAIPLSMRAAETAAGYIPVQENDGIMRFDDIQELETYIPEIPNDLLRQLSESVAELDQDRTGELIHEIFNRLRNGPPISLRNLNLVAMEILLCATRGMPVDHQQITSCLQSCETIQKQYCAQSGLDEMETHLLDALKSFIQLQATSRLPQETDLIRESREFIREHASEDISLKRIADHFYINPTYFSELFKRKTGVKYQDYVTSLRIEKARRLLETTDMNLKQITTAVGYSDLYYFTRVFERETGCKPLDYRAERAHRSTRPLPES